MGMRRIAWVAVAGLLALGVWAPSAANAGNGCGLIGEPCCDGTTCSQGTCLGCMNAEAGQGSGAQLCEPTCEDCGLPGLGCCPYDVCSEGYVCLQPEDCNDEALSGKGSGAGDCEAIGGGGWAEADCFPCGGPGQPCCDFGVCDPGSICEFPFKMEYEGVGSGGITNPTPQCIPCGGAGQPCCEKATCNEGFVCDLPCDVETVGSGSGAGAPCERNGASAGGGATEVGPLGECLPCGGLGELCCEESECDGENLLCGGEFCEACGGIGEQCCAENTCPNANAVCQEGLCEALPAAPLMGWQVMLTLIGVLVAVGSLGVGLRTRRQ